MKNEISTVCVFDTWPWNPQILRFLDESFYFQNHVPVLMEIANRGDTLRPLLLARPSDSVVLVLLGPSIQTHWFSTLLRFSGFDPVCLDPVSMSGVTHL